MCQGRKRHQSTTSGGGRRRSERLDAEGQAIDDLAGRMGHVVAVVNLDERAVNTFDDAGLADGVVSATQVGAAWVRACRPRHVTGDAGCRPLCSRVDVGVDVDTGDGVRVRVRVGVGVGVGSADAEGKAVDQRAGRARRFVAVVHLDEDAADALDDRGLALSVVRAARVRAVRQGALVAGGAELRRAPDEQDGDSRKQERHDRRCHCASAGGTNCRMTCAARSGIRQFRVRVPDRRCRASVPDVSGASQRSPRSDHRHQQPHFAARPRANAEDMPTPSGEDVRVPPRAVRHRPGGAVDNDGAQEEGRQEEEEVVGEEVGQIEHGGPDQTRRARPGGDRPGSWCRRAPSAGHCRQQRRRRLPPVRSMAGTGRQPQRARRRDAIAFRCGTWPPAHSHAPAIVRGRHGRQDDRWADSPDGGGRRRPQGRRDGAGAGRCRRERTGRAPDDRSAPGVHQWGYEHGRHAAGPGRRRRTG